MKIANGRSEISRISFVREPTVQRWIAGDTVPSLVDKEGVTTNLAVLPKRIQVQLLVRSAVHPVMDEEIV